MSKDVVVHLEYADDMVVMCNSMEDLKCFVREVDRVFCDYTYTCQKIMHDGC